MSIFLTKQKIIKDWTDYNGHMNVAYYVLIFDQFGSEVLLTNFNMGEHSAKTTKKSLKHSFTYSLFFVLFATLSSTIISPLIYFFRTN